ncbi:sulfate ABC transporter substrate-binding protein [Novosphingobium sp. Rr 2-17]|uniref:sulfate ABC transporter substrate-binding protein n=1 Tax=Novosphingobium sp. Rr 2-17 TaxID=555793 RepID=UPI000269A544|nr:sulfate ABC transporter substrate-binding protein [Novosphingobium sp. Rr 2-17]EIZ78527.1 sulfate ABC transporter substrate-binding protein [Novosphingobium sp. Rr 2-17]
MTRFATLRAAALGLALLLPACSGSSGNKDGKVQITNVSYDPTRELYEAINPAFAAYWKKKTGQDVTFRMSHGGSGKQSRAIIDGLDADVATLALAYDIDAIADKAKLLPADWQKAFPDNASPYTSTIVFLVRKGNPKGIKDWGDLVKPGVEVITANPKTGGGARWNFLAAYAYGRKVGGSDQAAEAYVKNLFAHVPVLDSGARGSTTTFVERGIGDVLLTWENEAFLAEKELGKGKFQIVVPSISILAEPPVAVIAANAKKHGTEEVSKAYLDYLYTPEAQVAIARNFYRPRDPKIAEQFKANFPEVPMVTIDKDFGGWRKVQKQFFDDGGVFDRVSTIKK